jgi:tetratricopeptide (TPR) repeat protein
MLWAGRDYTRTAEYFRHAHELAREIGDRALVARSLNRIANLNVNIEEPEEGLRHHEEALAIFTELDDRVGIAETLDFLTMANALTGDMHKSLVCAAEAIELFREMDDRRSLTGILATLGFCGPSIESRTLVPVPRVLALSLGPEDDAVKLAGQIGWRAGEAYALEQLAYSYTAIGEYRAALDASLRAGAIADEIGHAQWQTASAASLGAIYLDVFDEERGLASFRRALEGGRTLGSLHWRRTSAGFLTGSYADCGRLGEAAETLAGEFSEHLPMISLGQRALWYGAAVLAQGHGDHERALDIYQQLADSAPHADGHGLGAVPGIAWRAAGSLIALGRLPEADMALAAALARAQDWPMLPMVWRLLAAISELRIAQGRMDDAAHTAADALGVIDRLAQELDGELKATFQAARPVARLRAIAMDS